jgi:hypothetical protein
MSVILETSTDKILEHRVIDRIEAANVSMQAIQMPPFSVVDYCLTRSGDMFALLEVKVRKPTIETVKGYGGLMLKERKITELNQLSDLLQLPSFVAFAFEQGDGPILLCDVGRLTGLPAVAPPERRNFRGLDCDLDPVVMLDWDKHLSRLL